MKHDLNEVYKDFEKENITVLPFRFQHLKSVSLGDEKVVGIDRSKIDGCAEEYTILIHEKGHFDSGAFYTASSPYLLKEQAERRADLPFCGIFRWRNCGNALLREWLKYGIWQSILV